MLCVRTSASSLILFVASLIYEKGGKSDICSEYEKRKTYLFVGHTQAELFNTALNGIPASQTVTEKV